MKYIFNNDNKDIIERICDINDVSINDIKNNFIVDYNIKIVKEFANKLLENKDKKFLIVGDYDCDGICATTIIKKLLEELNIKCNYYIPSRSKDGYGLNTRIVDNAIENKFDFLFLVDNGVSAKECVDYALENDIKTFIIDHHEYKNTVNSYAFLHPNLFSSDYSDMCASGLCSLLANTIKHDDYYTVLGGLATLADSVRVLGYNRYLIKEACRLLSLYDFKSIKALLNGEVTYKELQFNVIPKINSVSRIDEFLNVNYVVKYLLDNDNNFEYYLSNIEAINNARKEYSKSMFEKAIKDVVDDKDLIVISSPLYKEGLCGLLANRLMNKYNKAVLVFSEGDNEFKGSGRAPKGCNLYGYLEKAKELFSSFGGHLQAVGLSLNKDNFKKFNEYINTNAIEYSSIEQNVLEIDVGNINNKLLEKLDDILPFGPGFEEPLFAIKNPTIISKTLAANKYPKYILENNIQAISFNSDHVSKEFEYMIGYIQKDTYHNDGVSFLIEDLI